MANVSLLNKPGSETHSVQITTDKDAKLDPDGWFPWVNAEPGKAGLDMTVGLALHRFIRLRGGVLLEEELTVCVHVVTPAMRDADGKPTICHRVEYVVTKK